MGLLGAFFNKRAIQYSITTPTSTSTGAPIETLTVVRSSLPVYFGPNPPRAFRLYDPGQVKIGDFVCFSERQVTNRQVLEIDSVKYRVLAANPLQFKNRVLAYVIYMEYYKQ